MTPAIPQPVVGEAASNTAPYGVAFPKILGPYRVLSVLGEGGMGRVYLGEHPVIGRRVAIKVLAAEVARDPEVVARFFTEARSVNEIRHPNIVEVTDFGDHEGRPFIVMEYLEGQTIADRIDRDGALADDVVVRIARQLASALGAVHERGIVHRDLKPANVFLREHPDYPDFVKVLDFGIAKLMGRDDGRPDGHTHRVQTQAGTLLGTPAYMSPEQCLGDAALDLRSDIYSMGIVLYEMATGRHPFRAETMGQLILAHVNEAPVVPSAVASHVSAGMSAIILKAMAKRPVDRYGSMRALRAALDELAGGPAEITGQGLAANAAVAATIAVAPAPAGAPAARARASTPGAPAAPAARSAARPAAAQPPPPAARAAPQMSRTSMATAAGSGPVVAAALAASAKVAAPPQSLATMVRGRVQAGAPELPALPPPCASVLQIAASPGFSFAAALEILRREPRLTSLLIRMANVEPYGSLVPAMSLEQAIARIGAQGLSLGLLEFAARPVIESRNPRVEQLFRRPWQHALAGAFIARRLVQIAVPEAEPGYAYQAALLRDIGRPLVAALVADTDRRTRTAAAPGATTEATWLACVESNHAVVASRLADSWRLAAPVVAALAPSTDDGPSQPTPLRAAVRLAALLADLEGFFIHKDDLPRAEAELQQARAALGVDEALTRRAVQRVKEWVLTRG